MAEEFVEEIDSSEIRWIQTGEPHAAEVYNRPTEDLRQKINNRLGDINESLSEISSNSEDASIVYAIALG